MSHYARQRTANTRSLELHDGIQEKNMAPYHPQWGLYLLLAFLLVDVAFRCVSFAIQWSNEFLARETLAESGSAPQTVPLPSASPRNMKYDFKGR